MIALLAAFALQIAAARPADIPVQMAYSVRPETLTVGDHFTFVVRVLAPPGARFEFPAGPDTTGESGVRPVELVGPKLVTMHGDTAVAGYRLAVWDVGSQPLRIPDIVVSYGSAVRRLPLGDATVFIKSVLPSDTSLRKPKPARAPIRLVAFNWVPLLALLAALLAALALWLLWRRWRRRSLAPIDPYQRAIAEFGRIERTDMLQSGRFAEYHSAMVDVLRDYLAARVPGVRRSHTTAELLDGFPLRSGEALQGGAELLGGVENELPPLLQKSDMVKFAQRTVNADEARDAGKTSRAIVDRIEALLSNVREAAVPENSVTTGQDRAA